MCRRYKIQCSNTTHSTRASQRISMRWKMHRNSRAKQETRFLTPNSSPLPQQPCCPCNNFHLQTTTGKSRILLTKLGRSVRRTSNHQKKRLMCPELPWEPKINSEQRMEQACLPLPMRYLLLKQRHWSNTSTRFPLQHSRRKKS